MPLRLPPHEVAAEGEEQAVYRRPCEEHPEIETDARVEIEERGARGFDDWKNVNTLSQNCEMRKLTLMQRPRIPPVVELRRQVQRIKARRHITDNPEDQPHRSPRLPNDHRHVLARQAQRYHPYPVDHPIHNESRCAVCVGIVCHLVPWRGWVVEGDLEGEGDEGIEKGHGQVGSHCGEPAVDDELVEVEWRVAGGDEELHVRGHVEGEGEEGDNDQVDEANGHGGDGDRRVERAEVED